ncbi:MAG: ferritin family protein [Candidatus Delongbacteria bacterium]|nr:ferritin family protein [Candidatus Delongbacteria bacterium]
MNNSEYKAIITIAVGNEVEAHEFYKGVADKATDASLKSIFNELAEDELKHKQLLEGYLNNDLKEMTFNETKDYKITESLPLPELSMDMKYTDAIVLAMKKEKDAVEMYNKFADASVNEEQKNIFLELSKMEKGHKAKLEDIYNDTAFVEVW